MYRECHLVWLYFVTTFVNFATSQNSFAVPSVTVQALKPVGLRASIADVRGIQLFAFNGRINDAINSTLIGDISGEVIGPTDGRWVFEDETTALSVGDVISYWVFIQYDDLGYRKEGLTYTVDRLYSAEEGVPVSVDTPTIPTPTPTPTSTPTKEPTCSNSKTTVRGQSVCAGQLIFEENFSSLDLSRWQVEHRLPVEDQEYPFVFYSNRESIVSVANHQLNIRPDLLQNVPPYTEESILSGTLDLYNGCTGFANQCSIKASGSNILPPVISGRINTKKSFSFKYGTIEIRAKVPTGDWLYPELFLEPASNKYGLDGYSSGMMRIGTVRGNTVLRDLDLDNVIDSKLVYSGIVLDQFECHFKGLSQYVSNAALGNTFHTYSLLWKPDSIAVSIDGIDYGSVMAPPEGFAGNFADCPDIKAETARRWKKGTSFAPFDEEFFITLGVGAGSVTEFPDNVVTELGKRKPWSNLSSKAKIRFWESLNERRTTWGPGAALIVDSVRVWAL